MLPYDPEWPRRFERERLLLEEVFGDREARIEHVGSTAVPGLGAKPVIDILVGLVRLSDAEESSAALAKMGYEYVPAYESQIPDRRYFRKPRSGAREYHLHCVLEGGELWTHHLMFRDYLRAHPESAADYYELKCDLATRCSKEEYVEAKGPFIERILTLARAWSPTKRTRSNK